MVVTPLSPTAAANPSNSRHYQHPNHNSSDGSNDGVPILPADVSALMALVWPSSDCASARAAQKVWLGQGFEWSSEPNCSSFFTQRSNGPCGVLAAVQGFLLRHLLFPDDPTTTPPRDPCSCDITRRQEALALALADILWRARGPPDQPKMKVVVGGEGDNKKLSGVVGTDTDTETAAAAAAAATVPHTSGSGGAGEQGHCHQSGAVVRLLCVDTATSGAAAAAAAAAAAGDNAAQAAITSTRSSSIPNPNPNPDPDPSSSMSPALAHLMQGSLAVSVYTTQTDLVAALTARLSHFTDPGGVLLLLYSLLLTKGTDVVRAESGPLVVSLLGEDACCEHALVNLLLTGCARDSVDDDSWAAWSGVCPVGFSTAMPQYYPARCFRCPIFPIWVTHGGGHYTTLYSRDFKVLEFLAKEESRLLQVQKQSEQITSASVAAASSSSSSSSSLSLSSSAAAAAPAAAAATSKSGRPKKRARSEEDDLQTKVVQTEEERQLAAALALSLVNPRVTASNEESGVGGVSKSSNNMAANVTALTEKEMEEEEEDPELAAALALSLAGAGHDTVDINATQRRGSMANVTDIVAADSAAAGSTAEAAAVVVASPQHTHLQEARVSSTASAAAATTTTTTNTTTTNTNTNTTDVSDDKLPMLIKEEEEDPELAAALAMSLADSTTVADAASAGGASTALTGSDSPLPPLVAVEEDDEMARAIAASLADFGGGGANSGTMDPTSAPYAGSYTSAATTAAAAAVTGDAQDEEDMARAIAASLADAGISDGAAAAAGTSSTDDEMSRAIAASLATSSGGAAAAAAAAGADANVGVMTVFWHFNGLKPPGVADGQLVRLVRMEVMLYGMVASKVGAALTPQEEANRARRIKKVLSKQPVPGGNRVHGPFHYLTVCHVDGSMEGYSGGEGEGEGEGGIRLPRRPPAPGIPVRCRDCYLKDPPIWSAFVDESSSLCRSCAQPADQCGWCHWLTWDELPVAEQRSWQRREAPAILQLFRRTWPLAEATFDDGVPPAMWG